MKKAFTLAEVLITLLIIGVVAALTIPSVISNYQQQEFKTGLKKAVSVLNEAIQTNIALEGETPYENNDLRAYLQRHMSVLKSGVFWDTSTELYAHNRFFFTTDGMRFEFGGGLAEEGNLYLYETGILLQRVKLNPSDPRPWNQIFMGACGSYGLSANPNNTINTPCVVTVDVNGDKKPNPSGAEYKHEYWDNGDISRTYTEAYKYPSPSDKKLTDVFNILVTDEKAIPFGVVAQRAMYSK